MKTYNLYTMISTSRAGTETEIKMYSVAADVEQVYAALGNHQRIGNVKVMFRKPFKVEHYSAYIGAV